MNIKFVVLLATLCAIAAAAPAQDSEESDSESVNEYDRLNVKVAQPVKKSFFVRFAGPKGVKYEPPKKVVKSSIK